MVPDFSETEIPVLCAPETLSRPLPDVLHVTPVMRVQPWPMKITQIVVYTCDAMVLHQTILFKLNSSS